MYNSFSIYTICLFSSLQMPCAWRFQRTQICYSDSITDPSVPLNTLITWKEGQYCGRFRDTGGNYLWKSVHSLRKQYKHSRNYKKKKKNDKEQWQQQPSCNNKTAIDEPNLNSQQKNLLVLLDINLALTADTAQK